MADLIEKIGRFFAEQEAQIQETYSHATHAPVRVKPSLSKPPPPVHRIPSNVNAPPSASPVPKPPRSRSILRRRQSLKSAVDPKQTQSWEDGINELLQDQNKATEVPSFRSSHPSRPLLPPEPIWDHRLSGGLDSWEPSCSPVNSRSSSVKDEELNSRNSSDTVGKLRKPRPLQQKHRKRLRRKKRSSNQEEDPEKVAKANAEKVAAALALAQERAKRLQQEKSQQEREQELERQEAACRLQEQMRKIELVRARSFRQSSSTMATARSSLSNGDIEYVWTADMNDIQKEPSEFMVQLEAQLREKMLLEMGVKQSYIHKHKQRERVRLKLEKIRQQNAVQSSKVSRLSALKASLGMELEAVLDDTSQTRQQRRELELADEKERLKRQREAERALQVRLREEEWSNMMEEEKARTQVAAEAREKASKRVEAHSAKLRRMMQAYRYEPRQSSSTDKSNNDCEEEGSRTTCFKMDFFLPPELADFEEDGLCNNPEHLEPPTAFRWQVPSFSDSKKFTEILLGIASDDEDE
ncbi:hypothetical protein V7S43_005830 [Phytophthora oleae]|uniref:Uncharacterized protein n=1 Tax=Phytophthora oleae TaxID=2107226 RepID=A0ABD3FT38_9STRA